MSAAERPDQAGRYVRIVGGVALLAATAAVLLTAWPQGFSAPVGDPYDYGKIGRGLVEHGFDRLTRRAAMLYPHVLAGIYWAGGGDRLVQVLHVLMHVGTSLLVFRIGKHLYNLRTGLIGGLVIALHPMMLRYVPDLHSESLLAFLYTLVVWRAIRFYDHPGVRTGIVLGGIGMLATLAKGVILPFLALFGALWIVRGLMSPRERPALLGAVAMFVTMAVVVAPWTYRNYKVTGGKFVLLTPGTPDAFLRGYIFTRLEFATLQKAPYTYAENESNALFRRIAEEAGTTWELDEVQDDVNNGLYMRRMIFEHPLDTVRKCVVGLFTFWYEMTSLKNSLVPGVLAVIAWVLAFCGFRRARDAGYPSWLLLMPILVSNVFVAALIPLGRYSMPLLPCLAVLAAFGVDTLLEKRATRRPSDQVYN